MGNCVIKSESGMHWAGDDWGSLVPETRFSGDMTGQKSCRKAADMEKERFLAGDGRTKAITGKRIAEVKIRVPKTPQLEELLGRMGGVKRLGVEEVLAKLMRAGRYDQSFEAHPRSWRPALRSIPEVN